MVVRPAAVAGMFYPAEAAALAHQISRSLAVAERELEKGLPVPRALIVPHAGYIYSGVTAAFAYQAVRESPFRRVVLFGPAHRVGFQGMAVPESEVFRTPLGDISVDQEAVRRALVHAQVQASDAPHAEEHSLEVQLPFLQSVLQHFELLPVCVGMVEPQAVAEVMELFLDEKETLIVISSDLSHFHDYQRANAIDAATVDAMLTIQWPVTHEQACGATAINALLILADKYGLEPRLLDYRNSGDTAGDKNRVVGYASMAWFEQGGLNE
ncbi:AmmeMemoRadiSam system protein B [Mariprofundus sp. KV]|uniref:AmmeMemoRadiSam system protein B n=1 Tax=Mariprofundus sp. KV TaxID=2608715 RepID=UPI0015A3CCAC|nr:AmmeMemoRadiSam system protein B [Mariprofundus sp. KV]NWF36416.1 AmmeMemoRadiSam system protein B [Mariprofundus sp. KV]